MKKTIFIASSILIAFALISCESTKTSSKAPATKIETVADDDAMITDLNETVEESDEEAPESAESEESEKSDEIAELDESDDFDEYESYDGSATPSTKKKNGFVWGNTEKFIVTEEFNLFSPNALLKYKQKPAYVTIEPKEHTAGFGSAYMLSYYILMFEPDGMEKYQKAVDNYLHDFEAKKLIRKSSKTYKKYGSVKIKEYWGTIKSSTPNYGYPRCFFGYEFYEGSPYFMISVPKVTNEIYLNFNPKAEKESNTIKYYFTKAQAKKLAEYLNTEYTEPVIANHNLELTGGVIQDADEY